MNQEKLNELVSAAYKTANGLITEGKEEPIMPVFVLLDRANKVHIIGTPFSNDEEKDATAAFIRKKAKEIDALAYIHVSEAWMISRHRDDPSEFVRPSESEGRREVLIVAGQDTDGNHIGRMWDIERDADNKRSLGAEDVEFRDVEAMGGRFSNLLSE